ncbi:uncharacterized protein LOC111127927 isoform X2 [Crassostrea virginica]
MTEVRPRQEALQCDRCDAWQHRTCDTGVTRQQYRRMNKGRETLEYTCINCSQVEPDQHSNLTDHEVQTSFSFANVLESTRVSTNTLPSLLEDLSTAETRQNTSIDHADNPDHDPQEISQPTTQDDGPYQQFNLPPPVNESTVLEHPPTENSEQDETVFFFKLSFCYK